MIGSWRGAPVTPRPGPARHVRAFFRPGFFKKEQTSMNPIIPFQSGEFSIRAVDIDGEPWFVGKDVAQALGYADPTNAIKQHCKGVVKHHPLQTTPLCAG